MKRQKQKILEYNVIFQEEKKGGYSVWAPELPGCASQGESFDEALKNIRDAIQLYLETSKKDSFVPSYRKQFVVPVQISYA